MTNSNCILIVCFSDKVTFTLAEVQSLSKGADVGLIPERSASAL